MAVAQRMSESEYQAFVRSTPEGAWELHDGRLVEKPRMIWKHGEIPLLLARQLLDQLDRDEYRVVAELRVRRSATTVFLPDLMVVPTHYSDAIRDQPVLAIFTEPLPLVVEIWSPSTGDYDVDTKIPVYRQRGDLEIWRMHPYERTLTSWRRRPDGTYRFAEYHGGVISLAALPGVVVDLDRVLAS